MSNVKEKKMNILSNYNYKYLFCKNKNDFLKKV